MASIWELAGNKKFLLNSATFKLEIPAYWVEISYGQILFLSSQRIKESKNKI
jgi:hypothetical protein